MPIIRVLQKDDFRTVYRIESGREEIAPAWATNLRRHGERVEPWSEITVRHTPGEPDRVVAWGGSVWPSAWPELFPSGEDGLGVRMTDAGRVALADAGAVHAAHHETTPCAR